MGALFLYLDSTKCATKVSVLHLFTETERKRFCHATFSPTVSVLGEAAETVWHRVIVKSSLCFTTIVHGSFTFSIKKSPFTLEFQMLREQKVSCMLATSFKILVANTQFLVRLATSESQFLTLQLHQQGLKGSFSSYFNLVANFSEQSSQHFSVGHQCLLKALSSVA